jgi:PIN domain nuclease of toxin-antitoxin system
LDKLVIIGGFNTIEDFLNNNDFEILPIDFDDIKALLKLEMIHHAPFDRMIISQAQTTNSTVISKDKQIRNYNVKILW